MAVGNLGSVLIRPYDVLTVRCVCCCLMRVLPLCFGQTDIRARLFQCTNSKGFFRVLEIPEFSQVICSLHQGLFDGGDMDSSAFVKRLVCRSVNVASRFVSGITGLGVWNIRTSCSLLRSMQRECGLTAVVASNKTTICVGTAIRSYI